MSTPRTRTAQAQPILDATGATAGNVPDDDLAARFEEAFSELADCIGRVGPAISEAFRQIGEAFGSLASGLESVADAWKEPAGCWADVWDDAEGDYVACDADPTPGSRLGLCARHARPRRPMGA